MSQLNQMQQAFIGAASAKLGTPGGGRWVDRVVRAADRIKVSNPKGGVKLSYRTAQKLKEQGVI